MRCGERAAVLISLASKCFVFSYYCLAFTQSILRSVHNIRIERLWVDVTAHVGRQWKEFFRNLEDYYGFVVDNEAHIWLLHHLFLPRLNQALKNWILVWNNHNVSTSNKSPNDMYCQGMMAHGFRGLFPDELALDQLSDYGIDWTAYDQRSIRDHHDQHNPSAVATEDGRNPFLAEQPETWNYVEVPSTPCPLDAAHLQQLEVYLQQHPCYRSIDWSHLSQLWLDALAYVTRMFPQ
jgi:hypothetical protein